MTTSYENFYIPKHLDDPDRFLFWTWDEALTLLIPFIGGQLLGYFATGAFVGMGSLYFFKKLKSSEGGSHFIHLLYWILPHSVFGFKAMPASYRRRYLI